MIGDAGDRAVLVDADLLPVLEQALAHVAAPEYVIVFGHEVPDTSITGVVAYDDLIAGEPDDYPRRDIDERQAMGLCYTSGTTGRPKGAVYTHRSTFLHALAVTSHAGMSIGPGDAVLPQVPMFHANAWGMPYAAAAVGAKQVFFAGALEPSAFVNLMWLMQAVSGPCNAICSSFPAIRALASVNRQLSPPERWKVREGP